MTAAPISNLISNCTISALSSCTTVEFSDIGNQSKPTISGSVPRPGNKELQCQAPTQTEFIGQAVFLIIILLVTLFGNSLVCVSVILNRRLRTVTNFFVVSLAVSDLLVSLLSLPFRINQTLDNFTWCNSEIMCQTWYIVDSLCAITSVWNLVMISVDRYIAIVHPFEYQTFMSKRNACILFVVVWINATVWAFLSLLNWTEPGQRTYFINPACQKFDPVYYTATSAVQFFLPLLIVLVMYGNVFRVAMNQARAVAAQQTGGNHRARRGSLSLIREMKAAKTLAIVVGVFIICWMPFFVIVLIVYWSKSIINFSRTHPDAWKGVYFTFQFVLPTLNSTLNPIIYAVFNRDFRAAFTKLIGQVFTGRLKPFRDDHSLTTYTTVNDSNIQRKSEGNKKTRFGSREVSGDTDPIENGEEGKSLMELSNKPDKKAGRNINNGKAVHKF